MRNEILGRVHASDWEHKILPLREQARVRDSWLMHRLDQILPQLMREEGLDMWILTADEHHATPLMKSLLPTTMQLFVMRRTFLVFHLQADGTLERLALSRFNMRPHYQDAWNFRNEEQWACLTRLVRERQPRAIGVDIAETFAFGDGLTVTEHKLLQAALGDELSSRMRSAEGLAVRWLELRSKDEVEAYTGIVQIAQGVIAEAFSSRVVHPGITTCNDVVWWMRQRMQALGLPAWFQPSVSLRRKGEAWLQGNVVIAPGDVIHCDVGLEYLGLCTDHQQHAYVLRLGETDAPAGLQAALQMANRMQDIVIEEILVGRSGNEVLRAARTQADGLGIDCHVYSHPIGNHGHGAGPVIGFWEAQDGVPGKGDLPINNDTVYALELMIKLQVPEWDNQPVIMAVEEDIAVTGHKVYLLGERQTRFHLIG